MRSCCFNESDCALYTVNIFHYYVTFQSPSYRSKMIGIDDIALANIVEVYQGKHVVFVVISFFPILNLIACML